jgi:predicted anti-sigma-YlaC factor YlaD
MSCDKNKEMIGEYYDGELEKGSEAYVFTHLAECAECREYFKSLSLITSAIQKEEFPADLEERIFGAINRKESGTRTKLFKRFFVPVSYAVTILLIILSVILFNRITDYKYQIDSVTRQVQAQNQTIELLFNSLPAAQVDAKIKNAVIIKAKM